MNSLTPRPVKNIVTGAHFVQVECGTFHTIALTKLGDVYTFGFNGNGRLGLAEAGTLDTAQRNCPVLLKSFENLAAKDHEEIGVPTDESQAATTALVKALRPKRVSHLCLGGFYSAALTDQGESSTSSTIRSTIPAATHPPSLSPSVHSSLTTPPTHSPSLPLPSLPTPPCTTRGYLHLG